LISQRTSAILYSDGAAHGANLNVRNRELKQRNIIFLKLTQIGCVFKNRRLFRRCDDQLTEKDSLIGLLESKCWPPIQYITRGQCVHAGQMYTTRDPCVHCTCYLNVSSAGSMTRLPATLTLSIPANCKQPEVTVYMLTICTLSGVSVYMLANCTLSEVNVYIMANCTLPEVRMYMLPECLQSREHVLVVSNHSPSPNWPTTVYTTGGHCVHADYVYTIRGQCVHAGQLYTN
jgi:hypothetical protein